MRDYEVQFLVRVQVEAPDIRTATDQTHISVKLTDAPPGETDCTVDWEYTNRWGRGRLCDRTMGGERRQFRAGCGRARGRE